jgi:hypothetical protein
MLIACTRCAQPTRTHQVGPHARPVRSEPQARPHSGRAGLKAHYHGPNYIKGIPYELGFHQAAAGHIVHRRPHPPRHLPTHDSLSTLPRPSLRRTVHRRAIQAIVADQHRRHGCVLLGDRPGPVTPRQWQGHAHILHGSSRPGIRRRPFHAHPSGERRIGEWAPPPTRGSTSVRAPPPMSRLHRRAGSSTGILAHPPVSRLLHRHGLHR